VRKTLIARSVAMAMALSLVLFGAGALAAQSASSPDASDPREAVIRLLPTRDAVVSGKTLIEALLIDPTVHTVRFYVDGVQAATSKLPPWSAKVQLASPAREQRVRVEAVNGKDHILGVDEIIVNRAAAPLRVDLLALDRSVDTLEVRARISLPLEVELEKVVVYLNETPKASFTASNLVDDELEASIRYPAADDRDYVRVVARLADGREIEDTELVTGATFQEEIDVHLVQLQVLVTNKQGDALKGLRKEHFRIQERGVSRDPAGLFVADDVSLLLGLAIDSSGSMRALWPETRRAAEDFLESTVRSRDEGFLIDFDTRLHLIEPRTGDLAALTAGLAELEPEGGTALYDSILYGLIQFDRQQGRRALIVITDGFDIDSKADPKRTIEFGRKLGVPVYIIAMENTGGRGLAGRAGGAGRGGIGGFGGQAGGLGSNAGAVQTLHVVTDPTGGRMFRARTTEQLTRAFAQINSDLRNQYVLTYYTDKPPKPGEPPEVKIELEGFKNLEITTLLGADQIY